MSESNWPGTNFGGHCEDGRYFWNGDIPSKLSSECQTLKEDINYCKDKGVKILLSIGGPNNAGQDSNYEVTTELNGEYFAQFLYDSFGPYKQGYTGPRPIDLNPVNRSFVDGFDFSIYQNFR